MPMIPKPLPVLAGLVGEYYGWCRQGELRFQRCRQCGAFRHVPRDICAACSSFDWDWVKSSGRGAVYTWTVVARALHPGFAGDEPYAPVVVEGSDPVPMHQRMAEVLEAAIRDIRAIQRGAREGGPVQRPQNGKLVHQPRSITPDPSSLQGLFEHQQRPLGEHP